MITVFPEARVDEELRRRIAASLDLPDDAVADPVVVRALESDPEAQPYARGLYVIEAALRRWPLSARREDAAGRRFDAIIAALEKTDRAARVQHAPSRPSEDFDATAAPLFDDDPAPFTEKHPTMSEPNDIDADHEALAALARTSTLPGSSAVAGVRPARPSLVDEVDETSSGLIDIKTLSALARDTRASFPGLPPPSEPPPASAAAPTESASEAGSDAPAKAAEAKSAVPATAKPSTKKDDVMVTTRPGAPSPRVEPEEKRRNTGPIWAIAGVAATAAAFMVFGSETRSPTSAASVEQSAPASNAVTEGVPAPAPPPSPSVSPSVSENTPTPETSAAAPMPAPMPAPLAAPTAAGPPPEPTPAAGGDRAEQLVAGPGARRARAGAPSAPARPALVARTVMPSEAAPTPSQAARSPAPPAAPAVAAGPARAGRPAAPAASAAPAAPSGSVDDLMNRLGGGPARPAAAPTHAAAPAEDPSTLPERLNRSQVTSVLGPLNGAVRSCAGAQTGTAPVSLVINGDGSVATANVSGQFSGTPVGECIAGVVRRARFPRFRAPTQNMMFPYVIAPRQ